ncbi:MAG TPA: NADH-dependent [FeFe] hydrogenase, group A6 [Chlamydiales bacterium]|mgnify:CR=1 FL=1|nr:NADH-dependent [FeFe] hydrogenase, group A6 [Chlamydiales bacterium]
MKTVTIKIDGNSVTVAENLTIMQAAEEIGIHIPRLCYLENLSIEGACRVCIVEVKGAPAYVTSCSTKVVEGMEVTTNSPQIREARRDIVELILDNHPKDCQLCERDGNCELQNLAYTLGIRERLFEGKRKDFPIEDSSKSVVRVPEKCILCGRCVRVCHEVQGVYNLSQQSRGFNTIVTPAYQRHMDDSVCIQCGQCINACPTAALQEKRHTEQVFKALADPEMHVVVQTAPAIRAAIGEGFNFPPGTPCTGKMVTALKKLGFNAIFDTDFAADLTIVEEAHELMGRIQENKNLPLITSCSPGWINFMEKFYPELIPNASSCKSPMSMLSSLIKTHYAKKNGIDPKKIYVVSIMPCVAKKYEMDREELLLDGIKTTDAVLTTRELIWMIKSYGIEFSRLEDSDFDSPLGESTGASVIFGTTGGVMEAALRTAAHWITKKPVHEIEFKEVRAVEGLRELELTIDNITLNIGVANGLVNAKKLLNKVISGEKQFHVIEVMACPGGCIGGGGQPYPPKGYTILDKKLFAKRAEALYKIDQEKTIRVSHENPSIKALYKELLKEPGSDVAHHLLHTHYNTQTPRGVR